jgi:pyruvate,water dikinase
MDIEWAKDGLTGELFIVQARPETVHSAKRIQASAEVYHLQAKPGVPLVIGQAVGEKIGAGCAHIVTDVSKLQEVVLPLPHEESRAAVSLLLPTSSRLRSSRRK